MPPREPSLGKGGFSGRTSSKLTLDTLGPSGSLSSRRMSLVEIIPPIVNALASEGPLFQAQPAFVDTNTTPHLSIPNVRVCLDDSLFQGPDYRKLAWLCMVADIRAQRSYQVQDGPVDAALLLKLRECAATISPKKAVLELLEEFSSVDVFPFLEALLRGSTMPLMPESGSQTGGDYLEYINLLNQLMMMATQLHNDALDPRNHKYAAHQVAILYQSLNMLKGQTKPLRKRIEERFDEIKTITENAASPYLGAELQYWSGNLPLRVPFPST